MGPGNWRLGAWSKIFGDSRAPIIGLCAQLGRFRITIDYLHAYVTLQRTLLFNHLMGNEKYLLIFRDSERLAAIH